MPQKTAAEIAYSSLEYTSEFKRPILEAQAAPAKLIGAVLDVLQPFGYKLDGVELNTLTRNLTEYSIIFRRSTPMVPARSLTVGLGKVSVTAQNLDWTEAEQFILEQSAALNVIHQIGGAQVHSHQLVVG
jgi:hypothetical protein